MEITSNQSILIGSAFQRGWRTLLREERVTAKNIEDIAGKLLRGILAAVVEGEKNELSVVAQALAFVNKPQAAPMKRHSLRLVRSLH